MPIQPDHFIQCQSDGYIAIRTIGGQLLGCIPGLPPQEDFLQTPIGAIAVWGAMVYCAVPSEEQRARLHELPGFVPVDAQSLDLARPLDPGDQSDLGEEV